MWKTYSKLIQIIHSFYTTYSQAVDNLWIAERGEMGKMGKMGKMENSILAGIGNAQFVLK